MTDVHNLLHEHERDVAKALESLASSQDSYNKANDRLDACVVKFVNAMNGRRTFEAALRHALMCHTMQKEPKVVDSVGEVQLLWDEHLAVTSGRLVQASTAEEIDPKALQEAATAHWSAMKAYWVFKKVVGHAQEAEERLCL